MNDSRPDPLRRSIFRILTDPDAAGEFGRQFGRALRDLREAIDPPVVPEEQYHAEVAQQELLQQERDALQQQVDALQRQIEEQKFWLNVAEHDRRIVEAIEQVLAAASTSPRAQQDLVRWENLRNALWLILGGIAGATTTALYESWVQENLYPLVKGLPVWAQEQWTELLAPTLVQPLSPLESPLPTQPTSPLESPAGAQKAPHSQPDVQKAQRRYRWYSHAFDWVTVPAGYFVMGSDKSKDPQAADWELPQHRLYLPTFRIARVPVTNAQFRDFVESSGYRTTAEEQGFGYVWDKVVGKWVKKAGAFWQKPCGPDSDILAKSYHPVTQVSWNDTQAFCVWAGVRPPSEAEWEKAARGTDGPIYPWGNDPPTDKHANYNRNVGDTTPVGNYPKGASPYGCLDMMGNVGEWTRSLWGEDKYKPRYQYPYDPYDGRESVNAEQGSVYRMLRGVSWLTGGYAVRCAARYGDLLWIGTYCVGFRVVSPGF